jgi:hypothetical protein
MTIDVLTDEQQASPVLPSELHLVDHLSLAASEAMLRASAIMALFGIIVIHFVQLVPTFQTMPLLGVAYLGLIAATTVVGARLVKGSPCQIRLWMPAAVLGVLALGGYAFTRVFSTPLDNQDVGNWACTLGMAALVVEGLLVALSVYAIWSSTRRSGADARSSAGMLPATENCTKTPRPGGPDQDFGIPQPPTSF